MQACRCLVDTKGQKHLDSYLPAPNHLAELRVCSTELQGDTKHFRHFTKIPKSRSLNMIRPLLSRQKREVSQDVIKPIYDLHHCLDPLSTVMKDPDIVCLNL